MGPSDDRFLRRNWQKRPPASSGKKVSGRGRWYNEHERAYRGRQGKAAGYRRALRAAYRASRAALRSASNATARAAVSAVSLRSSASRAACSAAFAACSAALRAASASLAAWRSAIRTSRASLIAFRAACCSLTAGSLGPGLVWNRSRAAFLAAAAAFSRSLKLAFLCAWDGVALGGRLSVGIAHTYNGHGS